MATPFRRSLEAEADLKPGLVTLEVRQVERERFPDRTAGDLHVPAA